MSRLIAIGALLAALAPGRGAAQVALGVRVGYALGLGDVGGALAMGDWIGAQIPLQLDVTYRLRPNLAVGAYYSHGFGRLDGDAATACDAPGADCSASIRRLGVRVVRALSPVRRVTPWLGASAGYEWSRLAATQPAGRVHARLSGWEYLALEAGADYPVHARLGLGPYLTLSIGRYGEGELDGAGGEVRGRAVHAWLGAGVRGRYDL